MDLADKARKAAASAGVALATTGLSSCNDNGAVDPLPPPLECNTLNMGQSLTATATRSASDVSITINSGGYGWEVSRVIDLTGGALVSIGLPATGSTQPLSMLLRLTNPVPTQASFTVEGRFHGSLDNQRCSMRRTFTLNVSSTAVQITAIDDDDLPLTARQRAQIELVSHAGRAVELKARSPYHGAHDAHWTVSHGELSAPTGETVRWTLPTEPGVYQAELVMDYGVDGMAIDQLLLEVSGRAES